MNNDLLNITNLNVKFMINQNVIEVLKDINISIEKQDTVAIIGESGSGKTILAKTICGILPNNLYEICGKINYNGENINLKQGINEKYVSIVLQNPMQSFSETVKIKNFMNDVFKANKIHEEDDNIIVLNVDDENCMKLKTHTKAKVITFGVNKYADYKAENIYFGHFI